MLVLWAAGGRAAACTEASSHRWNWVTAQHGSAQQYQQQQRRHISEEQLNASKDHLQELFEKNLETASRKRTSPLLTTRREALALYREILRYSNLFVWKDPKGQVWRDVIRTSTRKEYEDARVETDPEIINRLIITGREAVQRTVESFMQKRAAIIQEEAEAQGRGPGPGAPGRML